MGVREGAAAPSHRTTTNIGIICASVDAFIPIPDNWNFNTSNPCLYSGGNYNQYLDYGMLCVYYGGTSDTNPNIGCRHLAYIG